MLHNTKQLMIVSVCLLQSSPTDGKDMRTDIFHLVSQDYCICSVTILQGLQAWGIGFNSGKRISDKVNVKYGFGNSRKVKEVSNDL